MKIVIDTNIFVSSFISESGNPRKIIDLWKTGAITLCLTKDLIEEYIDVLNRFDIINKMEIKRLLNLFKKGINVIFIGSPPHLNIIKVDPDDNKFLECAVASHAKYIVSGDSHLKDLKIYKNIKIVTADEILKEMNKDICNKRLI
jgi:uncharacterized protein